MDDVTDNIWQALADGIVSMLFRPKSRHTITQSRHTITQSSSPVALAKSPVLWVWDDKGRVR